MFASIGLVSVVLVVSACGRGTVSLGEEPEDNDCPLFVASSEVLVFQDAYFDLGSRGSIEVDNRCIGDGDLVLELAIDNEEAAFLVPDGPVTIAPGGRATLDFAFNPGDYGSYETTVTYRTNDPEVPEFTVTLQGAAAPDQDGDGFPAIAAGGDDCDDTDASVHPGREERDDLIDQDCDGLVDEDFLRPGDIMITEIFSLPSSDPRARQWVEVKNTSDRAISLQNWSLASTEVELSLSGSAVLEPGQSGVLARSEDIRGIGIPREPTAVLVGDDTLVTLVGNWTLTLAAGANPVYILEGDGFPRVQEGVSLQLDPTIDDPFEATRGDRWCQSTGTLPSGERATPFAENTWCPQIDHDGDGTPLSRDCDDADPDRSPDAAEVLDGIDNNCDGKVDQLEVAGSETASVTGFAWERWWSIGAGDFNDDGQQDVVFVGSSSRRAHLIDVTRLSGATTLSSVQEDALFSTGFDPIPVSVPAEAEDVDGDGIDDIVYAAQSFPQEGKAVFASVSTDGDLVPDILVQLDTFSALSSVRSDVALLDMNGDGAFEVWSGVGAMENLDGAAYLLDLEDVSGTVHLDDVGLRTLTGRSGRRASLGAGAATADLNDDGYTDVVMRDGASFGGASQAYLIAGAARVGDDGDVEDEADVVLERLGVVSRTFPAARPEVGDLDGDGTLDLVIPGEAVTNIWFDTTDLMANGARRSDAEILSIGSGPLCSSTLIDQDNDDEDGLLIGWSDSAWGGNSGVGYFTGSVLSGSLRPDRDSEGGVDSGEIGDLLGCGAYAGNVAGGPGDDLFIMAPQRRDSRGAFMPTLWYFEAE